MAEASKVIENTQRDVNIGLINELAMICDRLDLDTTEVLEAAKTKWNFLPFAPGLVGGHCIGVDPYYLAHAAIQKNMHPQVILAGRAVNESVSGFVVNRLLKMLVEKGLPISGSNVLVMGFAFKENCPDVRNSKVFEITANLVEYGFV